MAGFTVDVDAVSAFSKELFLVGCDLSSSTYVGDLSISDIGDAGLLDALEQFHRNWQGQQQTVLDNLEKLAQTVREAAKGYGAADAAVVQAADAGS